MQDALEVSTSELWRSELGLRLLQRHSTLNALVPYTPAMRIQGAVILYSSALEQPPPDHTKTRLQWKSLTGKATPLQPVTEVPRLPSCILISSKIAINATSLMALNNSTQHTGQDSHESQSQNNLHLNTRNRQSYRKAEQQPPFKLKHVIKEYSFFEVC